MDSKFSLLVNLCLNIVGFYWNKFFYIRNKVFNFYWKTMFLQKMSNKCGLKMNINFCKPSVIE